MNLAIKNRKITKMAVLAYELHIDESAISRWRRGGAMSLKNAAQLCIYLDVSLDWLILDRGGMLAQREFSASPDELDLLLALRMLPPACTDLLSRFLAIITDRVAPQVRS